MAPHDHKTFVNRDDDVVPLLRVPSRDEADDDEDIDTLEGNKPRKRDALKDTADRVKDKLLGHVKAEFLPGSLSDRLFTSILGQIIPADSVEGNVHPAVEDRPSRTYVSRPGFSLPLMSSNFRRFNARVGILFVFQNTLTRLFSWRTPTHTLSFLAVYTLLCLQPALIPAVPFGIVFFFLMIPSFLTRHPPPPFPTDGPQSFLDSTTDVDTAWASYAYASQPTAPPQRVVPVPEASKDFFRNMRDLQNSMDDFTRAHDSTLAAIAPSTDFSDEQLSSSVFLALLVSMLVATSAFHLVPWHIVTMLAGWAVVIAGHPRGQEIIITFSRSKSVKDAREISKTWIRDWVESDIVLDEPPEIQEVEIFELQRRHNRSYVADSPDMQRRKRSSVVSMTSRSTGQKHSSTRQTSDEISEDHDEYDENWESWLFSPSPHDPLCPQRLSGAWPTGTQFFEEVSAPREWSWKDKKWTMDLLSDIWVEERCITGVEVEQDGGRWVYDLAHPEGEYGSHRITKESSQKDPAANGWEEGVGQAAKGEWRRRRWVRLVERKAQKVSDSV